MRRSSEYGMTLMEVLLVVSLMSLTSLALYNALSNGIKVYKRSNQLIIEEDVAIFFDKLSNDLNNAFFFSQFELAGTPHRMVFPTIIKPAVENEDRAYPFIDRDIMGLVEYYYDNKSQTVYRRQAFYGKALSSEFSRPREVLKSVADVRFAFVYLTENGEIVSERILDFMPSGVEIEVDLNDTFGHRTIATYVDIPVTI